MHSIEIYAHRGASAYAPENTLPAFKLAVELGADGVEFDVQLSADGEVVVIHDETLGRTTDGSGMVGESTLSQLKRLAATAGLTGFATVKIPTLHEVLDLLAFTKLKINIELKDSQVAYLDLAEKTVSLVAKYGLSDRVIYSSFSQSSLQHLRQIGADPVGYLYQNVSLRPWKRALELNATAVHPPAVAVFGCWHVEKMHAVGLQVRPWVVNRERRLSQLMRWGVDGIFSDCPDVAIAVRERLGVS